MADINKTIHTGRISTTLELKQTQSGLSVMSFNLAVDRPRVKNITDFIPVVCWRQNAEYLAKYANKGTLISVIGTLQSRKYTDKNNIERTVYEIVADEVSILSKAGAVTGAEASQPTFTESDAPTFSDNATPNFEELASDDKLPF